MLFNTLAKDMYSRILCGFMGEKNLHDAVVNKEMREGEEVNLETCS